MKREFYWPTGALAVLVGVAISLGAVAASAGADDEEPAYSAAAGSVTYRTYCANCHGSDARGEGYIAATLRVRPTDLTLLAKRNGGEYPAERVREAIDGRLEVRTHGRREMPIWGDIFLWPEGDSAERRLHVKRKIGELVEHLRSLQEPADKG